MAATAANFEVLEFYKQLPFNYHGQAGNQANMIRARDAAEAYPILLPLLGPEVSVLEVGCGTGWFALSLRLHHRCRVMGIDYNPVAIERAQEMAQKLRQKVHFEVADLFCFDLPEPADLVVSRAGGAPAAATLAGRSCENDEIGEYILPEDVRAGDAIAMRYAGAYTFSMASNYNRFGKPAVVFVGDGTHRRVVNRESDAETSRCDVM